MTAVGWDTEDYPEEACTGPCRCTTPHTDKPRRPGLLARLGITLRTARKGHARTGEPS